MLRQQQTAKFILSRHTGSRLRLRFRLLSTVSGGLALALGLVASTSQASEYFPFVPGTLLVSSSTYAGTAATVTVGQPLPGGGTAIANGSYPGVFENATVDGSFGVTSPIILKHMPFPPTTVRCFSSIPSMSRIKPA